MLITGRRISGSSILVSNFNRHSLLSNRIHQRASRLHQRPADSHRISYAAFAVASAPSAARLARAQTHRVGVFWRQPRPPLGSPRSSNFANRLRWENSVATTRHWWDGSLRCCPCPCSHRRHTDQLAARPEGSPTPAPASAATSGRPGRRASTPAHRASAGTRRPSLLLDQ